jgi:hypothetical protein
MKEYVNEKDIDCLIYDGYLSMGAHGRKFNFTLADDKHLMVEVYDDADRPYIGYAKEDGLVWDSPPDIGGVYMTSKFYRVLVHQINQWLSNYR